MGNFSPLLLPSLLLCFTVASATAEREDQDLCASPQECWPCWLFGLWLYRLADRSSPTILQASLQHMGQAETWKASCWDSADRRLLWGADIIRAKSRSHLLFSLSEGKRELKKERGVERDRMEDGFKQCEVKIVAQLPWQRHALGGQSPWLLTLPRSPGLLLKTISLPVSSCHFHIHSSPPFPHLHSSCSRRCYICRLVYRHCVFYSCNSTCVFVSMLTAIKWYCKSDSCAWTYSHQCTHTSLHKARVHEEDRSDT